MLVGSQWQFQQWAAYARQLQAQMQVQMEKMERLEKTVEALQVELKACKEQKRIHIDKIEYKFDQLKVEKLDGTMNIGLTPGALENLAVNGENTDKSATLSDTGNVNGFQTINGDQPFMPPLGIREEISKELHRFMEEQVPKQIDQLQQQSGKQLDEWHRKMVQQDLTKQLEGRMDYYLRQMSQGVTVDQLSSIKDSVMFRTQQDIRSALQQYFQKMPSKGGVAK
ncbi:spore germination protein PC [Paenibacillus sp. 1_12]|uniref:spore germination protein GerPC n=1 Tax=Paenibacillus sp. 1_12 TaxID=1566278 RepID=UPI0008E7A5C5|nr:spore germination protein GerPC [Paenibacillus sp. 1_12]SFL44423.1 spore germination protein PC [Paenibacillus sp. 1_12]